MTLQGVHPGDMIRAGGGHAVVLEVRRGELAVRFVGSGGLRVLRAVEVEAHWRRSRK